MLSPDELARLPAGAVLGLIWGQGVWRGRWARRAGGRPPSWPGPWQMGEFSFVLASALVASGAIENRVCALVGAVACRRASAVLVDSCRSPGCAVSARPATAG